MADKKLNITADLKVKTTDAERTLQKLSKEGIKISNILKGLDINTSGGRAGFAKSLMTANKEMLKLRGTTHDTAKVMEHVYGRQLEKQTKNLDKYTKKIEDLNKKFKFQNYNAGMQREFGNDALANRFAGQANRTADKIVVAEAARQAIQAAIKEMRGEGSNKTDWDKVRGTLAITQSIMSGGSQLLGTFQSGKTMSAQNLAGVRDYERGLLSRMSSGDFSDLYFSGRKMVGGKTFLQHAKDQAGGQMAARGQLALQAASGAGQIAQGIITPMPMGGGAGGAGAGSVMTRGDYANMSSGVAGGVNTIADAMQRSMKGGPQALEAATVAQQLEFQKAQDPMTMAALNFIQSTAGMRVGASKALQGRHMGAWGIGMGHGLDMGESFALAQGLSRQFGVDATMGGGGGSTRRKLMGFGGVSEREAQLTQMAGMESRIASGQKVGSIAEYRRSIGRDPATGQIVGSETVGGGRAGLMGSVLGLERMGLDRSVAGSALGTMMQGAGGNIGKANKALEDIMTKAFGRGIHDARLGEEIVRASGEMAFGYGGAVRDMASVGMALSGGLDANSTLRQVQANVSGFSAVNSLLSSNPYFQAVSAESSLGVLGSGGTGTQMMASQKASLSDLIGGSEMLTAAGITDDQRRRMLNARVSSLMGAFLTNANDPQTAGLRNALGASGGDIVSALQGGGGKLNDQFALALSSSSNIGFEQAQGFARDLQGFGSTADRGAKRRNFASHGDATAEATVRSQQEVLNELFKKEIQIRKDYLDSLSGNTPAKIAATIGQNNPDYEAFNKFFEDFMRVMREAFERSRSQMPTTPSKATPR